MSLELKQTQRIAKSNMELYLKSLKRKKELIEKVSLIIDELIEDGAVLSAAKLTDIIDYYE